MRRRWLAGAFVGILLVAAGCQDDGTADFGQPSVTQVTFECSPASPVAGSLTTLTVTAHNASTKIDTIAVDFEDDGTWDFEQAFDALSVTAHFEHVYDTAGSVVARTEVEDFNGAIVSRTLLLTVESPPSPPGGARQRLSGSP